MLLHFLLAAALLFLASSLAPANAYILHCDSLRGNGDGSQGEYDFGDDYSGDGYKLATPCDSATDNTRGKYKAKLSPCVFSFHKSDTDNGSDFKTSTVCSNKNKINDVVIKEYVSNWPDECVADFSRCYSVNRDEEIFRAFFCKKKTWKIPENTTHISVDCTADKAAKVAVNQNRTRTNGFEDPYFEQQKNMTLTKMHKEEEHMHRLELMAIVMFATIFSACLICIKCAYVYLLRPYYDKLSIHEE
jgi:hypothetical protein